MHLSGVCVDQCGTRAADFCLVGFPLIGVTEYGLFPGVGAAATLVERLIPLTGVVQELSCDIVAADHILEDMFVIFISTLWIHGFCKMRRLFSEPSLP